MTSAIEQINEDVVHRSDETRSEELLTSNDLVELPPKRLKIMNSKLCITAAS